MKLPDVIITERSALKPFLEHDLYALIAFMTDENVTNWRTFTDEDKTAVGVRDLLEMVKDSYTKQHLIFSLVIALNESGSTSGYCPRSRTESPVVAEFASVAVKKLSFPS